MSPWRFEADGSRFSRRYRQQGAATPVFIVTSWSPLLALPAASCL
jgi:hypothetical protein